MRTTPETQFATLVVAARIGGVVALLFAAQDALSRRRSGDFAPPVTNHAR